MEQQNGWLGRLSEVVRLGRKWLFRRFSGWFGRKRVARTLQGYGRVEIAVHFDENAHRKWEKFVKRYKPEVKVCGRNKMSDHLFYVGDLTIDGLHVRVYGPYTPNPDYDEAAVDVALKNTYLKNLLFCGYKHKAVKIDAAKIKDISKCSWEYSQVKDDIERVVEK